MQARMFKTTPNLRTPLLEGLQLQDSSAALIPSEGNIESKDQSQGKKRTLHSIEQVCYEMILDLLPLRDRVRLSQTSRAFRLKDIDLSSHALMKKSMDDVEKERVRTHCTLGLSLSIALRFALPVFFLTTTIWLSMQVAASRPEESSGAEVPAFSGIVCLGTIVGALTCCGGLDSNGYFNPTKILLSKAPEELQDGVALYNKLFPLNKIENDEMTYSELQQHFCQARNAIKTYLQGTPPAQSQTLTYKKQKSAFFNKIEIVIDDLAPASAAAAAASYP